MQQVLRKDPDNTDAGRLFKHLKAVDKAKRAGNAAFEAGELDEANLEFCCEAIASRRLDMQSGRGQPQHIGDGLAKGGIEVDVRRRPGRWQLAKDKTRRRGQD